MWFDSSLVPNQSNYSFVMHEPLNEPLQAPVQSLAMKPCCSTSVDDLTVERILHALSDPVRVAIWHADIVNKAGHVDVRQLPEDL